MACLVSGFLIGGLVLLGLSYFLGNTDLDAIGGAQGWFFMGGLFFGLATGALLGIIIVIYKVIKNRWNTKQN